MTFRFGMFAASTSVLLAGSLFPQSPIPKKERNSGWTATVQVLVRDKQGTPLAGLGPDDFILTEMGTRDAVLAVRSLAPQTRLSNGSEPALPPSQSALSQTSILLVFAPMSASGRNFSIAGLMKFLRGPGVADWSLALIDDAGKFTSFAHDHTALRAKLQDIATHVSSPQLIGGSWITEVARAIQVLAIRPGRHAIIFASDFESNLASPDAQNPKLLRVGPSEFIAEAMRAQAAMYTVEGSGPRVLVPFGGAAEFQYSGSGEQVAEAMNLELLGVAQNRADFLYPAQETGGVAARDIQEALSDVAMDATGYYQITFRPNLEETDGAWHPISVSVPGRPVRIRGPRYYLAPLSENQQKISAAMRKGLEKRAATARLESAAHVWLFPDVEGAHTALMAADFIWPAAANIQPPGPRLQIFAQLVDGSLGQVVGSWLSEEAWKPDASKSGPRIGSARLRSIPAHTR